MGNISQKKKKKQQQQQLSLTDKPVDEYGYPIRKYEQCFQCQDKFCLTFCFSQQNYSKKHSWFYWTEQEKDKNKYICPPCLGKFYREAREECLKAISAKKQSCLRSYIARKLV